MKYNSNSVSHIQISSHKNKSDIRFTQIRTDTAGCRRKCQGEGVETDSFRTEKLALTFNSTELKFKSCFSEPNMQSKTDFCYLHLKTCQGNQQVRQWFYIERPSLSQVPLSIFLNRLSSLERWSN